MNPYNGYQQRILEGMLCRWALAMQEYDFTIVHRKGSVNTNADALSWVPPPLCTLAVALLHYPLPNNEKPQMLDPLSTNQDCNPVMCHVIPFLIEVPCIGAKSCGNS